MILNAVCESCGGTFTTDEITLKINHLGEGIDETYFNCPQCNKYYPVMKTDIKIRGLQKKPMTIKEFANWEARQKEIKALIDVLNGR